jgi:cytidylate kinase
MSKPIPILAIDGPSGSGKGTITRLVADKLGWHVLDSGALYRVLALYAIQHNCALDHSEQLEKLAHQLPVEFKHGKVMLSGNDVTAAIRSEDCSVAASKVAVIPTVRTALISRQRAFAQLPGLVADGRDMGTVVFPQAFLKIYLDASEEERAKRRYSQLKDSGYNVNLQDLVVELVQRDERDKSRAVAPLKPAADAVIIDTSKMSISEVLDVVIAEARQRLNLV